MSSVAVLSLNVAGFPSASVYAIVQLLLFAFAPVAVRLRACGQVGGPASRQVGFELPGSRIEPFVSMSKRGPNGVVTAAAARPAPSPTAANRTATTTVRAAVTRRTPMPTTLGQGLLGW